MNERSTNATPGRSGGHVVPNVVVSPSVSGVSSHIRILRDSRTYNRPDLIRFHHWTRLTICSMHHRPALSRQCLAISHLPSTENSICSTDCKRLPRMSQRGSEHRVVNIHLGSMSQISANENSRNCQDSMKCRRTEDKSCSCKRLINVTSSSTSRTLAAT